MTIIFGILAGILAVICLIGMAKKKRYEGGLKDVSEKEFPSKNLLPIGLYVQEMLASTVGYKSGSIRNPDIIRKLSMLYGEKQLPKYKTIFTAERIAYGILMTAVGCFLTAASGELMLAGLLVGIMLIIVFGALPKRLDENIQDRDKDIRMEFPDFMSKFILLKGAGMTVTEAWNTACKSDNMTTPLYRELANTNLEINEKGTPVPVALMNFSIRCRNNDISRFVSTVVQFEEYGGFDLEATLTQQSNEAWKSRKQEALRQGQVASTKLSGITMLMFGAILIIVMAPALMSMSAVF